MTQWIEREARRAIDALAHPHPHPQEGPTMPATLADAIHAAFAEAVTDAAERIIASASDILDGYLTTGNMAHAVADLLNAPQAPAPPLPPAPAAPVVADTDASPDT